MAKTATIGYIHGLAMQLALQGTWVKHRLGRQLLRRGWGLGDHREGGDPDLVNTAVELNPMGHMRTPEEVAAPVVSVSRQATVAANLYGSGRTTTPDRQCSYPEPYGISRSWLSLVGLEAGRGR